MIRWEYRTVDLNGQVDELVLLNFAGDDGWELVVITDNRIAILKRQIVDDSAYGL